MQACTHLMQDSHMVFLNAPYQMRASVAMLDTQARAARPATRLPITWAALSRGSHANHMRVHEHVCHPPMAFITRSSTHKLHCNGIRHKGKVLWP